MSSILIEDGIVVTMNSHREVIPNGSVMVIEGKIVDVGASDSLRAVYRPEFRISAKGKAVIPGLIDAHVHLAQGLLRGCADDLSLIEWLRERIWPLQGNFTSEDGRVSAELSMLEMAKSGTTSFVGVDVVSRYGFDGIARTAESLGMRAVLAKSIMDNPSYGTNRKIMHPGLIEEKEACLREARAMISKWNPIEDGKVKVWLAPRSLGGCSKELYEEVAETARESQTGVTMHLAEVKEDIHYTETNYGQKPVEFIQSVGLTGRNVLFAHMVWLDEEEIHLVAKTGTNVVHCPSSNLKLASGIPKIPEMLVAGVNVSLGCDGAPCNNSYDLIRELKLAGLIQKARLLDPKAMPASTVMEMATINGARAIGMESELGSIEKGKRADLALIDLRKPHLVPYHDIVSNLVYSAMGSDVETVLIDGKIIVDKGNVRTIDETRVLAEADARRTDLIARAGIKL